MTDFPDPRALPPKRYINETASGTFVAQALTALGNTGVPGMVAPTTSTNIAADSSVSIVGTRRVLDAYSDLCYMDFTASIKITAWGAAVEMTADDVLPVEFALPTGVVQSIDIIGIEATAKTAHMFNITFGGGAAGRQVSIVATIAQIGPQVIANLESDSGGAATDVAFVSAGGGFEFPRVQIVYPITK